MSKRKSLADDLANLFNPAPAPGVDLPVLPDVDEDFDSHIKPTRTAKEKPLRLRGDIELHDQAYKGRKSTRAAVFDASDSDGDASGSDEDGDSGDEDDEDDLDDGLEPLGRSGHGRAGLNGFGSDEDESGSGEDDEDEESGEERRASGASASTRAAAPARASFKTNGTARKQQSLDRRRKQQRGDDEAEGGGGSSQEERGELSGEQDAGAEDLEQQQLDAEYRALEEAEAAALVGLRERVEKERVKGRAVAVQQRLYERSLEARILLQKVVGGGNVLPRPEELPGVLRLNEGLRSGYTELRTSALETLTTLLQLHSSLVANNPAIAAAVPPALPPGSNGTTPTPTAAAGSKRSSAAADRGLDDVEGAWAAMEEQWAAVAPFRDASLDRWHRRTMLAAGGAALKAGGLKALHQSISAQVSSLIRDNTKAVKRTRLSLSARPRVLCSSGAPPAALADDDARAPDAPRRGAASEAHEDGDEAQDPETFDDGEFYQQLLKELIDVSAAGGGAGGNTGQKKRKSVDRRASKGRKIRYHVHPKLVNFVAPVETALPVFAAQLFSNLFGRAAPAAAVAGNT